MLKPYRPPVIALCLLASVASAQTPSEVNVFFGFEYTLLPIAIKWSCGGDSEQDLSALNALAAAHPEDAKEAELQIIVETLLEISERKTGLTEIVGSEIGINLSQSQLDQLCAAALPLGIAVLSPASLLAGGSGDDLAPEQEAKWVEFYKIIEDFQTDASP
jgi:hypothetical protein